MIHPTIHLNGTSRDELIKQWGDAYSALNTAYYALCNAAPNGRDYYPQGAFAITQALLEHTERLQAIKTVMNELHALMDKAC